MDYWLWVIDYGFNDISVKKIKSKKKIIFFLKEVKRGCSPESYGHFRIAIGLIGF
jgi:hypothetical protein